MSRIGDAIEQIEIARRYTRNLLDHVNPEDWFRQPSEGVTHIAWQVGHLAMAEYRLTLERIRGSRPEDAELIPESLLVLFGKGSQPAPEPERYPPIDEIHSVLDRVHSRAMAELAETADSVLDEPPATPHPLFNTKLGSLRWCAHHEMLHAGQIGLLRRLLGKPWIR